MWNLKYFIIHLNHKLSFFFTPLFFEIIYVFLLIHIYIYIYTYIYIYEMLRTKTTRSAISAKKVTDV